VPSRQQIEAAQRASLKSANIQIRNQSAPSPYASSAVESTSPNASSRDAFKSLLSRLPPQDAAALEHAARSTPQIVDLFASLHSNRSSTESAPPLNPAATRPVSADYSAPVEGVSPTVHAVITPAASVPQSAPQEKTFWAPPQTHLSSPRGPAVKTGVVTLSKLHESKRRLVERLPLEGRRAAVRQAQDRKARAENEVSVLMRRLEEIPFEALSLEDRLVSSLGSSAADATKQRVRNFIDAYRARHAELALMSLSADDTEQLQDDISHTSMYVRALRDDLRNARALLERAGTELSGADSELQNNPSVLQMCAEQARRQRDEIVGEMEGETQRLITLFGESMRRFCVRAREQTTVRTADIDFELAEVRSMQADYTQQIEARLLEVHRTSEQRDRVAEEFMTLKDTVERFREGESQQEASLQAEVNALEEATKSSRHDAEFSLAMELEAVRSASAVEAEVSRQCSHVSPRQTI